MPADETLADAKWRNASWRSASIATGKEAMLTWNLLAEIDPRRLAAIVKPRWICEQAHLQLKEEFGLDHFEGLSWQVIHRHTLMTVLAYAFMRHSRIVKTREKRNRRAATRPAGHASTVVALIVRAIRSAIPIPQKAGQRKATPWTICQGRVSAHARRLYDRAGNGQSATSTRWRRAIFPRPRARRACVGRQ